MQAMAALNELAGCLERGVGARASHGTDDDAVAAIECQDARSQHFLVQGEQQQAQFTRLATRRFAQTQVRPGDAVQLKRGQARAATRHDALAQPRRKTPHHERVVRTDDTASGIEVEMRRNIRSVPALIEPRVGVRRPSQGFPCIE